MVSPSALARYRFEEGDWIAWGDSRRVMNIEVGRNTVFFATRAGVLRWDRNEQRWLYPWFSVPGPLDKAIQLTGSRRVLEDPLTLDLYVQTSMGWYLRDVATLRWEKSNGPSGVAAERINEKKRVSAEPSPGLITPQKYYITQEGKLGYRLIEWPFAVGAYDERGHYFYAWDGIGVGIAGEFTSVLTLYPGGPGPATALDVNADEIWAASVLDRDDGWLWERPRSGDSWVYHDPDLEWGLEPGNVNRIRIGDSGTVWLATSEGVMVRRKGSWRHVRRRDGLPRRKVLDLVPIGGDKAWVATLSGLGLVDARSGVVLRPDEKTERVARNESFYRMAVDADTVWAAMVGTFYRWDVDHGWRGVQGAPTIGAATVPTALYAGNGIIAVGDRMGFAWKEAKGEWRELFSQRWREGYVQAIAYHRGVFWLGTDRGLVKFDPKDGKVLLYTAEDGLVGSSVRVIIPEGDWLWLGTDRALVRFRWNAEGRTD